MTSSSFIVHQSNQSIATNNAREINQEIDVQRHQTGGSRSRASIGPFSFLKFKSKYLDLHVHSGGRGGSRCRLGGWCRNGGRGSASRDSHHAVAASPRALAVLHNHVRAKIKYGARAGTSCSARNSTDSQWVGRGCSLFIHRDGRSLTGVGRHTVDRLDKVNLRVGHHDLDRGKLTTPRTSARDIEQVLRVRDEHVGLPAGVKSAAKHGLDVVDGNVGGKARLLSPAADGAAHILR